MIKQRLGRFRTIRLLLGAAFLTTVIMGAAPATPTPVSNKPPLTPVSDDGIAEMQRDPIVTEGGVSRYSGQFYFTADQSFNTAVLRDIDPQTELISEDLPNGRGLRHLLARVPDSNLRAVMSQLRMTPGVHGVDRNQLFQLLSMPNDPYWATQLGDGLNLLHLDQAREITTGAATVRVAVVDSGVNAAPDLYPQLDPGINLTDSFNQGDTSDPVGHGTSVASIIAATTGNGTHIAGVAPNARIVPVKVCFNILFCPGNIVVQALDWIADQGNIKVVNMSLGITDAQEQIDGVLGLLSQLKIAVVAAAGNNGTTNLTYPASNPSVISVAGVAPSGQRNPGSSYGSNVWLAAPWDTIAINIYGYPEQFSGTSASAAVISGYAALFLGLTFKDHLDDPGFIWDTGNAYSPEIGAGVPNAYRFFWYYACKMYDFNGDKVINAVDEQMIAYRYNSFWGSLLYEYRFDRDPRSTLGDLDIDIKDLARVFGRDGFECV